MMILIEESSNINKNVQLWLLLINVTEKSHFVNKFYKFWIIIQAKVKPAKQYRAIKQDI